MTGMWKGVLQTGARYIRSSCRIDTYANVGEQLLLLGQERPSKPPLFIVGLPRSGTTLVYQYVVHRLSVAYFTNGVGRLPQSPSLVTLWQRIIHGDYLSDFQSYYGKVKGPSAPREAGGFWGTIFGFDDYVTYDSLSDRQVKRLVKTVACVERIFNGAPFFNKNVKHLLRIGALRRIFPECHFLIVERNRTDVALSLLRGKYNTLATPESWISARPPNYEELKNLTPVEQVAKQLESLNAKLEQDLSELGGKNVIRVNYEEFCDNPEHLIERLDASFLKLDRRNPAQEKFDRSKQHPRNKEEEALVKLVEGSNTM